MESLFLKVFNMGISAGWLILAVILCRFLLRRAPKSIRCILWAIVAFRLCCPISVESIFSLIPSSQTLTEETITTGEFHLESGIKLVDQPVNHYFIERRN